MGRIFNSRCRQRSLAMRMFVLASFLAIAGCSLVSQRNAFYRVDARGEQLLWEPPIRFLLVTEDETLREMLTTALNSKAQYKQVLAPKEATEDQLGLCSNALRSGADLVIVARRETGMWTPKHCLIECPMPWCFHKNGSIDCWVEMNGERWASDFVDLQFVATKECDYFYSRRVGVEDSMSRSDAQLGSLAEASLKNRVRRMSNEKLEQEIRPLLEYLLPLEPLKISEVTDTCAVAHRPSFNMGPPGDAMGATSTSTSTLTSTEPVRYYMVSRAYRGLGVARSVGNTPGIECVQPYADMDQLAVGDELLDVFSSAPRSLDIQPTFTTLTLLGEKNAWAFGGGLHVQWRPLVRGPTLTSALDVARAATQTGAGMFSIGGGYLVDAVPGYVQVDASLGVGTGVVFVDGAKDREYVHLQAFVGARFRVVSQWFFTAMLGYAQPLFISRPGVEVGGPLLRIGFLQRFY